MPRLSLEEFCAVVEQVLAQLPEPFHAWLANVTVDVEPDPWPVLYEELEIDLDEPLLGVFEGDAITEQEYGEHHPNRIVLFQNPIEEISRSEEEVRYEIRRTVLHELAHHFGYSEEDLDEFESQPSPFDEENGEWGMRNRE
jgi:predicted Zn-dependent protease with MMP-like domain